MTAEIAVMNKWAVALAADSKVTITGMRSSKAYDTVKKLFTLSKVHPIGIMIYGNAEFMEYPWETIIKMYRNQKGRKSEKTVELWGSDFVKFLSKFGKIDDEHKQKNISNVITSWLSEYIERVGALAGSRGISVGSEDYVRLLEAVLRKSSDDFVESGIWATKREQTAIIKKYAESISNSISGMLGSFKDEELLKVAVRFCVGALLCKETSPQSSGVVVAGFGDDEYFPTLVEYETDGYIGDKIKIHLKDVSDVSRDMKSCVRAFAQHDMVQRFMNGVDSGLMDTLIKNFKDNLVDSCLATLEKYGSKRNLNDKARAEIEEAANKSLEAVVEDADKYIGRRFSSPVINMVSLLPKDELAHLAESLVALTSLKRRVSSDAETVGGPIDVALISKGDGFVWIKRKHYFSADLNPQFTRKYMDSLVDGGIDDAGPSAAGSRGGFAKARPRRGRTAGDEKSQPNTDV